MLSLLACFAFLAQVSFKGLESKGSVHMAKIGYARVSTAGQDLELQTVALKEAGCEVIRAEAVSGGSRAQRKELETVLQFLRAGDVLVVTRLDRLARSMVDLLAIAQEVEARGAVFQCIEQPIDTGSAAGRLQMQMLGAFAEFERSILHERQKAGIAKAKAAGKYKGRPATIDAAQIKAMQDAGKGASAIARELNIARTSVYRVMQGAKIAKIAKRGRKEPAFVADSTK